MFLEIIREHNPILLFHNIFIFVIQNNLQLHCRMKRYEKHIFICENKRPEGHPRGCCADKGGSELKALFKKRIRELGLKSEVRANTSGCLDACEFGPSVVVYPEQIWYGGVTLDDVEEIIQSHIINNQPIERLFIKHPKFQKDAVKV